MINVIVHCDILFYFVSGIIFSPHSRDSDSEDSCDRPVQGPLPYEPEDAPWKKSEVSGIRKLWVLQSRVSLSLINFIDVCSPFGNTFNILKTYSTFRDV